MKIKPYTGPASLEVVIRTFYEALTGKLTLRDNAAVQLITVQWNSARGLRIPAPARPPVAVTMLRAFVSSNPSGMCSGGYVTWEPQPDGDLLITGIDPLNNSVEWTVDLMLVES